MMETLLLHNRRLLALLLGGLIIGGLSALMTIPRLEDPRPVNRRATIITRLPGASAERVEALVTETLERSVREVSEIDYIESESRAGVSVIGIELDAVVTESESIWSEIRDKMTDAETLLPPEASRPNLDTTRDAAAFSLIAGLVWNAPGDPEMSIMSRLAEELADRLRYLPGTEIARLYGAVSEEITVTVNAEEMAILGLSTADIAAAIATADTKLPSGTVHGRDADVLVQVDDDLDSVTRVGRVPLREGADGEMLRLHQVASVAKASVDPPRQIAIVDGGRAIMVAARIEDGFRLDAWAADADEVLKTFRGELPVGIAVDVVFEQLEYTNDRLSSLARNAVIGIAIVTLVVLVMMGWRSALLVGAAIPLTVSAVLIAMQFLGIPIHQISVIGLVIALGLLIDNAIVTVDEIRRHMNDGAGAEQAMRHAVRHLAVPLFGSTATTVLAFLPIMLVPGNVGDFIWTMGATVVLAVAFSFLISMTIIATLTGLFGVAAAAREGSPWWRTGLRAPRLQAAARGLLALSVRRPAVGFALGAALPLAGFSIVPLLQSQFFPASDRDQFYVQVWGPSAASIHAMRGRVDRMERMIRDQPGIERVDWLLGASPPNFYYNQILNQDDASHFAQALVHATSERTAYSAVRELQDSFDARMPDLQVVVRRLGQGPPVDAPVELRVSGPSIGRLRELGDEIRRHLADLPEVVHSRALLDGGEVKAWVRADEDEAHLAGLTLGEISAQLEGNLEGSLGGMVLEETEELPVRIRFANDNRHDLQRLSSLNLVAPDGAGWLPLSALGEIEIRPSLSTISRRDGERTNTIKAYVDSDGLPDEVTRTLLARLDEVGFTLPAGYRMEVGGDAAERQKSIAGLFAYVPMLAVLMVAVLVLSLRSFWLAGVLGAVAFMSVGLSALSVWSFGYPFTFMAIVGTFGLIGVAINDSIVVIAALRASDKASAGDEEAVVETVLGTGRHLISTTLTTIGGFVPLFLAGGFWPPLAAAIAGGVGGATIIAFVFVPAAYASLVRRGLLKPTSSPQHKQRPGADVVAVLAA